MDYDDIEINDLASDHLRAQDEEARAIVADYEARSEIRSVLDHLQVLADTPQLRHRLGYARVSVEAPYSDSRRPTDTNDGSRLWVMDYRSPAVDAQRNYAAGLL